MSGNAKGDTDVSAYGIWTRFSISAVAFVFHDVLIDADPR
jgi:hypothetical protein